MQVNKGFGNFLVAQVNAIRKALISKWSHENENRVRDEQYIVDRVEYMVKISSMCYDELVAFAKPVLGKLPCPSNY